jgi:predicted enzyme related to lactoylglutathione lyase
MIENTWFELPVKSLRRAKEFYEELLKDTITIKTSQNSKIAMMVNNSGKSFGCLYEESAFIPDMFGIVIYFELFNNIEEKIKKIEELGGKVLSYEKRIEEFDYQALIQDSEGNRIALFKQNEDFFNEA